MILLVKFNLIPNPSAQALSGEGNLKPSPERRGWGEVNFQSASKFIKSPKKLYPLFIFNPLFTMNRIRMLTFALMVAIGATAQKVELSLRYNVSSERYEVYANPSFSQKNFAWGPSQVTIVVPAKVDDRRFNIRTTQAGYWVNTSDVYAPDAAPNEDFHSFTTAGGKVDFYAGTAQPLFDFSLPGGYVEGVRMYRNGTDPSSTHAGMAGGDFANTITDGRLRELFSSDNKLMVTGMEGIPVEELETSKSQLFAYPNPVQGSTFRVFLTGFEATETVELSITNMQGHTVKTLQDKVQILRTKPIGLPQNGTATYLIGVRSMDNLQKPKLTTKVTTE
jgi:hypothetical protein